MKMTESKGSVYRDLDYKNPEEWEAKATLAAQIFDIIGSKGWTQTQAAEFLGTKQSEISRMNRGQFDHFTMDRLMAYLRKLETNVKITLEPRSDHQEGSLAVMSPFLKDL